MKPQEIANAFKKYFFNVAGDLLLNTHNFLSPLDINCFFFIPTNQIEVKSIIMSANHVKYIY